jgi:hypothetical protein
MHKGAHPTVEVSSHELGKAPSGASAFSADLVSASTDPSGPPEKGVSRHVAGFGSTLLYARADDALTTTLFRSNDYGATWKSEATFPGHLIDHVFLQRDAHVAVGPRGWAFVRPMCPPGSPPAKHDGCTARQVRRAGADFYEALVSDDDFEAMSFAFDEARGKVYAVGLFQSRYRIYESGLDQNRFVRFKNFSSFGGTAVSVDPSGVLRILAYERAWGSIATHPTVARRLPSTRRCSAAPSRWWGSGASCRAGTAPGRRRTVASRGRRWPRAAPS